MTFQFHFNWRWILLLSISFGIWYGFILGSRTWWLWLPVNIVIIWLTFGRGYRVAYLVYHTLGRDLRAARMMLGLIVMVKRAEWRNWTVPKMFSETARKCPDKAMLLFEDQKWTFKDVDECSNRVAHYFLEQGYVKGDTIAIFMENRPEFIALWLGLSKIGVVPALINYNLRKDSLIYSITVARCKAIIFGAELTDAVADIIDNLKEECQQKSFYPSYCTVGFRQNGPDLGRPRIATAVDLDQKLLDQSSEPVSAEIQDSIGFNDKLMFIYTSGTTGMPKAAVIKHSRYILASGGSCTVIGCRPTDIVYTPLPLYHSVAGMISLAGTMHYGITMVIRKKFSASAYWADCVKYDVTAAQYIGEICRYLLSASKCQEERQHKVRLMFGNGLRPQIWRRFVQRFNIPNISEFYGSTEGNSQIINNENREGAVGFVPILFPNILPLGLIKIDEETGQEIRDENGLCVPCKPGESGEFVGKIVRNDPVRDFHGYASDPSSTSKKLLSNVRSEGDLFFRSGDILVMDELGWLYFKDRAGDTFRWKGENVSTAEVEAVVSNLVQLQDAVAYGVEIPGCEGRAGMVSILISEAGQEGAEEKVLRSLAAGLADNLPSYARPIFVRFVGSVEMTGTFKLKKFNLQREGFDPRVISDKMFFFDLRTAATGKYEPLDDKLYDDIVNNVIRL